MATVIADSETMRVLNAIHVVWMKAKLRNDYVEEEWRELDKAVMALRAAPPPSSNPGETK